MEPGKAFFSSLVAEADGFRFSVTEAAWVFSDSNELSITVFFACAICIAVSSFLSLLKRIVNVAPPAIITAAAAAFHQLLFDLCNGITLATVPLLAISSRNATRWLFHSL